MRYGHCILDMKRAAKSLPPGTELDDYVIDRMVSRGGFSIVYLATHRATAEHVIVKEYMPAKLARRDRNLAVVPRDDNKTDYFNHGRRLLLQEAGALARLKHPNIVNVVNFFSAYGTVYMVMEYAQGENLHRYIKQRRGMLSGQFMLTVFPALLTGLQALHDARLLHLDIKPSNIHLRPGGLPLLLDFGAVHQTARTRQDQPTQVVTPGYSPVEQYDVSGYVGPWTDLYALGATMRACLDRRTPPSAPERRERDTLRPASAAFAGKYHPLLLEAIDWAMEVDPLLRPQSATAMFDALTAACGETTRAGGHTLSASLGRAR